MKCPKCEYPKMVDARFIEGKSCPACGKTLNIDELVGMIEKDAAEVATLKAEFVRICKLGLRAVRIADAIKPLSQKFVAIGGVNIQINKALREIEAKLGGEKT